MDHRMPVKPTARKPAFPHLVIVKAPALLPMLYRPPELEVELGVPARTIRRWLLAGLPHERDAAGGIWINGQALAAWVATRRQDARHRAPLQPGQAFCLGCRKAVTLAAPRRRQQGRRVLLSGACPACGRKINRGIRDDQ